VGGERFPRARGGTRRHRSDDTGERVRGVVAGLRGLTSERVGDRTGRRHGRGVLELLALAAPQVGLDGAVVAHLEGEGAGAVGAGARLVGQRGGGVGAGGAEEAQVGDRAERPDEPRRDRHGRGEPAETREESGGEVAPAEGVPREDVADAVGAAQGSREEAEGCERDAGAGPGGDGGAVGVEGHRDVR